MTHAQRKEPARRAMKDIDKSQKRDEFIRVAADLLLTQDFEQIAMSDVAARAGAAKGTLYLYFKTKEALFLKVQEQDYQEWFQALQDFLRENPQLTSQLFADWFSQSLRLRPRFLKSIPLVSTILEKNAGVQVIAEYKLTLAAALQTTAPLLQISLKLSNVMMAVQLLMQCHALVVGFWSHGFPEPDVQAVIEEHQLGAFDSDFFRLLTDGIMLLIDGYHFRLANAANSAS